MKLKKPLSLLAILFCVFLFSCDNDDASDTLGVENSYSFNDVSLQGKIDGKDWSLIDGYARKNPFDSSQFSLELLEETVEDDCPVLSGSNLPRVFFSIPANVGLYELRLSSGGERSQTLTLFEPSQTLNTIASQGAIEILTVADSQITGRIDARFDENNFINGNFLVTVCIEE